MKITDIFIKRPVLATAVNLFLLIAGYRSLQSLNVRQYPETKNAVVSVTTHYPGASADLVRGFITTPLEREIASADGLDYVESVSASGVSIIKAKLRLNYDPNAALTQITSKVNRVRGELPADAEDPIFDVSIGESTAAMYINFTSSVVEQNRVTDYLVRVVQPKLATVPGVQKAEVIGARTFAMRIWLKPDRMAALRLSPSDVRSALAVQNTLSAVGKTKGEMITVNLNARTDLHTAEDFRGLVIREHNGEVIHLRDVADVMLGAEDYDSAVKFSGKEATFIGINVLPTANSVDVIKGVRAILPEIEAQLPAGIAIAIPYDSTEFINDSIHEVVTTLVEAMFIVIAVIYLFLGSLRSVIIPIVAIPLSLVGACALMLVLGFSINLLTLLAMVLAIGLVVDDAIVVVENIHRHIEEGRTPIEAALVGARELVGAVVAMTITLAAVYAPIGFQGGLTGALFREFAFTLAGSVLVSGFVALTLSPMMSSRILRHASNPTGFAAFLDRTFNRLQGAYERLLDRALNARAAVFIVAGVVAAAIVPFFLMSKSELAPAEDRGFILALIKAAPNASIEQGLLYSDEMYRLVKDIPGSQDLFTVMGMDPTGGPPSPSTGMSGWVLKPWSQRKEGAQQLAATLQATAAGIPGLSVAVAMPPSLPGAGSGFPVQFIVASTLDHECVVTVADELLKRALASGNFVFGQNNLVFDQPQVDLVIDRQKAADLGITMNQLSGDLGTMMGGGYVNRFSIDGRAYKVIPQSSRSFRLTPDQMNSYHIKTGSGQLVALSTIATLKPTTQPRDLRRFQQLNAATLGLVPRPGVAMGEAVAWLDAEAEKLFPAGSTKDYAGEARQYKQEGSSLLGTFALAIIIIYLVLAAQYESFRDPLIIMMSVPLSISGAMVFLFLDFATLNIYTEVGLITLVGLITKHGILIVEFANKLQEREGYGIREAVEHAAGTRLRPILMTTAAMVLGVLPLVFAKGAGAESRFSIGLVIATGMSIGTFFTLFVVPSFYTPIARDRRPKATAVGELAEAPETATELSVA